MYKSLTITHQRNCWTVNILDGKDWTVYILDGKDILSLPILHFILHLIFHSNINYINGQGQELNTLQAKNN